MGVRLRPLTCAAPKPMMPVWGEPMLARVVALLRENGVDDIVVNCHYLHEQIEAWCAANGCRACYEPEILGTGGVFNPLRDWIGDDPFYLVNGDIVIEGLDDLRGLGCLGDDEVIGNCLITEDGARTIEVEPESGYVTNWRSDDAGCPGTFTYCGFAALKSEILKYVKPTGYSSVVAAYEKAMMDGKFLKVVRPKGLLWTDAGTIANYIDLNRDGKDNAFCDLPQMKAVGAREVEFLSARGSDRVFFKTEAGLAIVYDDASRGENAKYAGHAAWLKEMGVPVPAVISDCPDMKTTVFEWAGSERKATFEDSVKVIETLEKFARLG